ncbi:MAG: hypothetical protein M1542_08515 [Thermotogae bacterium]|jgi:hypothetical protein|nr:hypothetical protein [Thermotogota bacterium]
MNVIEQVGLPSVSGYAYSALENVKKFGKKLLIPEIIGGSSHISSVEELTGVQQFLEFLDNEKMGIDTPSDVWEFSTFVSYIADFRDIAAIQNSGNTPLILTDNAFTTETNVLQAATYTITTFSGECSAYARLYSAVQTLLKATNVYNVFFTPDNPNQGGHVTDLWTADGQTWHVSDYYNEYIGSNPLQLVAWLWATQYPNTVLSTSTKTVLNGWSNFSITIVENNFFAGDYDQSLFLTPVMSAHVDDLITQKIVNTTDVPTQSINHIQQSTWQPYQQLADKEFQIESYGNSSTSSVNPKPSKTSTNEYVIFGVLIAIALVAIMAN